LNLPPDALLLLDQWIIRLHIVVDHLLGLRGEVHQVMVDEPQPDIDGHVISDGVNIPRQPNQEHIVVDVVIIELGVLLINFSLPVS
jgi:hypothetical protein